MMNLPVDYTSITQQERRLVREEYAKRQGGKCIHCGNPLSGPASDEMTRRWVDRSLFPPTFFDHPVHLHHDHQSGLTIGASHCLCNAILWQYHGE